MLEFKIKSLESQEKIKDTFKFEIENLAKKHKVDVSIKDVVYDEKDIKLERILVTPTFLSKDLMSKNYKSFHKEYLDKYINSTTLDLMVLKVL